jgi:hypothetical protein
MEAGADAFGGSWVDSPTQRTWPFDRARLVITESEITLSQHQRHHHHVPGHRPLTVVSYRFLPFLMETIVWLDEQARIGFVPHRTRSVRRSLARNGWPVETRTKSWISWH